MNTTATASRTLGFSQLRTYLFAALFVAGNIVLPQLCHAAIPDGGRIFLPIYFFTLVAAWRFGWKVGLLTAVASPLVNCLGFGMPAVAMLPAIVVKGSLLAAACGWLGSRSQRPTLLLLAAAVLFYQTFGSLFEWAWTGQFAAAAQDFRIALPGMLIQVVGGYFAIRLLNRAAKAED